MKVKRKYRYGRWIQFEGSAAYYAPLRHVRCFEDNGWRVVTQSEIEISSWPYSRRSTVEGAILIPPQGRPESDGVMLDVEYPTPEELGAFVEGLWRELSPHRGKYYGFSYVFEVFSRGKSLYFRFEVYSDFPFWQARAEGLAEESPKIAYDKRDWDAVDVERNASWARREGDAVDLEIDARPRKTRRRAALDTRGLLPKIAMHHIDNYKRVETEPGHTALCERDEHYSVTMMSSFVGRIDYSNSGVRTFQRPLHLTDWILDQAVKALTEIEAWGATYQGDKQEFCVYPLTYKQAVRLKTLLAEILDEPRAFDIPPTSLGIIQWEEPNTKSIQGRLHEGFNWSDFDSDLEYDDAK
jgi:hypothetical protein